MLLINLYSCTDFNFIDGGLANGVHDCTMWEYFKNQPVDWDSTMVMIEHAGMKSYFDGSGKYKEITFFGITDLSIIRFLLNHNRQLDEEAAWTGEPVDESQYWRKVTDIPAEECASLLKKLIVPQRFMLKDIPQGTRLENPEEIGYIEQGGTVFSSLTGEVFVWVDPENYANIKDAGAKVLWIARRLNTASNWMIASSDIQTTNGVVHSLGYDFDMSKF